MKKIRSHLIFFAFCTPALKLKRAEHWALPLGSTLSEIPLFNLFRQSEDQFFDVIESPTSLPRTESSATSSMTQDALTEALQDLTLVRKARDDLTKMKDMLLDLQITDMPKIRNHPSHALELEEDLETAGFFDAILLLPEVDKKIEDLLVAATQNTNAATTRVREAMAEHVSKVCTAFASQSTPEVECFICLGEATLECPPFMCAYRHSLFYCDECFDQLFSEKAGFSKEGFVPVRDGKKMALEDKIEIMSENGVVLSKNRSQRVMMQKVLQEHCRKLANRCPYCRQMIWKPTLRSSLSTSWDGAMSRLLPNDVTSSSSGYSSPSVVIEAASNEDAAAQRLILDAQNLLHSSSSATQEQQQAQITAGNTDDQQPEQATTASNGDQQQLPRRNRGRRPRSSAQFQNPSCFVMAIAPIANLFEMGFRDGQNAARRAGSGTIVFPPPRTEENNDAGSATQDQSNADGEKPDNNDEQSNKTASEFPHVRTAFAALQRELTKIMEINEVQLLAYHGLSWAEDLSLVKQGLGEAMKADRLANRDGVAIKRLTAGPSPNW